MAGETIQPQIHMRLEMTRKLPLHQSRIPTHVLNAKSNYQRKTLGETMTRVGKCLHCGNRSDYNTPYVDEDLNIWCSRCAESDTSGKRFIGVEQNVNSMGMTTNDPTRITYLQYGVILWVQMDYKVTRTDTIWIKLYSTKRTLTAWLDGGRTAFPLTKYEQDNCADDPWGLIEYIHKVDTDGYFRCTRCLNTIPKADTGGYPLFAGRVCPQCWELHLAHLEEQRKSGHVCSLCGQPYGNCCC